MARIYTGLVGRVLGAAFASLMTATGLGTYVFVGVAATNVPIPAVVVELVPIEAGVGGSMGLPVLLFVGLFCFGLTAYGLYMTVEALVKPDYSIKVTSRGRSGGNW